MSFPWSSPSPEPSLFPGEAPAAWPSARPEARTACAAATGLSIAHKCTTAVVTASKWRIQIAKGGSCVRVVGGSTRGRPGKGGVRGIIKGFSRSSRKNAIDRIQKIDRRGIKGVFFVTMTVPAGEGSWSEIERWRRSWFQRFRTHWGSSGWFGWWRKEPHEDGRPHLHMLIFWKQRPPHVKAFRAWNDVAWAEIVKSENPAHQRVGCRVEGIRTWNGIAYYVSKYLSKEQECDLGEGTGRIWGIENRAQVEESVSDQSCEEWVGRQVRRSLHRWQRRKSRRLWVSLPGEKKCSVRYLLKRMGSPGQKNRLSEDVFIRGLRSIPGVRFSMRKPRCGRNVKEDIWSQVTSGPDVGRLEVIGQEVNFYPFSSVYIDDGEAEKLVAFFWAQYVERTQFELPSTADDIPF